MASDGEFQSHSAVAEFRSHSAVAAVHTYCGFCKQMLFPIVADASGMFHTFCVDLQSKQKSAFTKGEVYNCHVCGEDILHIGIGKVGTNCRTIGDPRRVARKCARECVEKRQREEDEGAVGPPPKVYCVRFDPPPLPPPSDPPPLDPY